MKRARSAGQVLRARRLRAQAGGVPGGIGGAFAYDAANLFSQESATWQPWLRSPDGEINHDRDRMVARSRDLIRNDGWATGGVTRILDSAIGSQFRLVAKPDYRALERFSPGFDASWADDFGRVVEAEWRMFADDLGRHCDAERHQTLTQMFWVALRHKVIDGDSLACLLWTPERVGAGGARYSTSVQLIDPDRLSNPYGQMDTLTLRGGVQLDGASAAAVGYHIRQAHQGDVYAAVPSMHWDYFPRETPWGRPIVVHDFDRERAGQHRGTGILTPILARMRMLSRYDQAELQQALLQTVFATVIESPLDREDLALATAGDEMIGAYQQLRGEHHAANPLMIGGVKVPHLAPGETLKSQSATRPNSGFEAFQSAVLRALAAATGLSAEQLTWDYSKTNYSSARAAMLEAWKTAIRRRDWFAMGFANPIYGAFLEEVLERGLAPLPRNAPPFAEMRTAYARCRWIGPARGWVDPVAERQGAVLGMEAGLGTLEDEAAEQGRDFEENLDQRALEIRMMQERGIPLPTWAAGSPNRPAEKQEKAK
jgi:lambda family phage portal protein